MDSERLVWRKRPSSQSWFTHFARTNGKQQSLAGTCVREDTAGQLLVPGGRSQLWLLLNKIAEKRWIASEGLFQTSPRN